jgi:hypothetical protein
VVAGRARILPIKHGSIAECSRQRDIPQRIRVLDGELGNLDHDVGDVDLGLPDATGDVLVSPTGRNEPTGVERTRSPSLDQPPEQGMNVIGDGNRGSNRHGPLIFFAEVRNRPTVDLHCSAASIAMSR